MIVKNKIFVNCKEATLLTCKKQDGKVSFKERMQLLLHLLVCKVCALFYKQSTLLHQQLTHIHQTETLPVSIQMDEERKKSLQEIIEKEIE